LSRDKNFFDVDKSTELFYVLVVFVSLRRKTQRRLDNESISSRATHVSWSSDDKTPSSSSSSTSS